MLKIKSLADLAKVKENAANQQALRTQTGKIEISLSLGTPAYAAGANETKQEILKFLEAHSLDSVFFRQTGSIGLDSEEPILRVWLPDQQEALYGKVTPRAAVRILQEHILEGQVVQDLLISI